MRASRRARRANALAGSSSTTRSHWTIASSSHVDVDVDALAAFATALCRRAHQAAAVGALGAVRVVALEAAAGRLLAAARGRLLLVVLAERDTSPGMIRLALTRALEGLA